MRNTPLLSNLRTKGGTLHTLATTTNDFAYLFSNSTVNIVPSHFALVKLPTWEDTTDQSMYFDGTFFTPAVTDPNLVFPKVIQNYTENMLSNSDFERNDNSLGTYSEQAIFKTLRLLGAMDFIADGSTIIDGNSYTLYKENTSAPNYEQVVKYVGQTNLINHRKDDDGNEFVSIHLHVPTEDGLMTDIQFTPKPHITHNSGLIPQGGGGTYSNGLDPFATTNQVEAIYDTGGNEYEVGNDLTDIGIDFENVLNDVNNHKQGDFEFNAIILYYTATDSSGNNTDRINAWGIHLLEDFDTAIGGVSSIPTITKYQPDNLQSGNSFNFKMNIAFSAGTFNISATTTDDFAYNQFLDLLDVVNKTNREVAKVRKEWADMQKTILNFSAAIGNYQRIQDSIEQIEQNSTDINSLKSWQSGGNGQRITNEELFALWQQVNNSISNATGAVSIYPILSSRTFLPNVIDPSNMIVEYNGTYYQWDVSQNGWNVVQLPL